MNFNSILKKIVDLDFTSKVILQSKVVYFYWINHWAQDSNEFSIGFKCHILKC